MRQAFIALEDIQILGHADDVKMVLISGAVQKNTL